MKKTNKKIPLIRPYITKEVKDRVCEVLDSGYLTEGPVTAEFENVFKQYIGCDHVLAVSSCTTGLEIALRAVGVGPGDEVIVPDYTYPATADVVAIVGARIIIVDVNPQTMLIDYEELEKAITPRTKAVIPVSLFGNPLNYDRLHVLKKKHGFYLMEDAACSIGAEYRGEKVGTIADISVFSLHPRKFITTGEGGLITTNNREWAVWMNSYKRFGVGASDSRKGTSFERIGSNYKLSNVLAAIGLVQMKHIDELLEKRLELSRRYEKFLSDCDDVKFPEKTSGSKHSYQSFCIFVENRNQVMKSMRSQGIEVQIGTYSLHMHPAFASRPYCQIRGDMPGSKYAFDHCLTLPMYHDMTTDEQKHVIDRLKDNV